MKSKLFNQDCSPSCSLCARCRKSPTESEMLCIVMGVVPEDFSCRKFRYDPLKRKPREANLQSLYAAEDFKL